VVWSRRHRAEPASRLPVHRTEAEVADPQPVFGRHFTRRRPDVPPTEHLRSGSDDSNRAAKPEHSPDQRLCPQRSTRREFLGHTDQVAAESDTRAPGGTEFGPATQSKLLRQSGPGRNLHRVATNVHG